MKEIEQHLGDLYYRHHENHAEIVALKLILGCILEQMPLDKGKLQESTTRYFDALTAVMEKDGTPEHVQQLQQEKIDELLGLLFRAI